MRDEFEAPFLDDWLQGTEVTPPDPREGARRVATRLPYTRQVGRWLPFPLRHRKVRIPTATDTAEYRPSPIAAGNGRAPITTGRTRLMFSPVKAVAGGALVFTLGAVFVIAQPFDRLGGGTPGAEQGVEPAAPLEPVAVTGVFTAEGDVQSYGSHFEKDGIGFATGPWWTFGWDASDPRLSGQGTAIRNWNESIATQTGIGTVTYVLVNEDGRWVGSGYSTTPMPKSYEMVVLHGENAYDGLTALILVTEDYSAPHSDIRLEGVIFPGEVPALPEPVEPPAE